MLCEFPTRIFNDKHSWAKTYIRIVLTSLGTKCVRISRKRNDGPISQNTTWTKNTHTHKRDKHLCHVSPTGLGNVLFNQNIQNMIVYQRYFCHGATWMNFQTRDWFSFENIFYLLYIYPKINPKNMVGVAQQNPNLPEPKQNHNPNKNYNPEKIAHGLFIVFNGTIQASQKRLSIASFFMIWLVSRGRNSKPFGSALFASTTLICHNQNHPRTT